MKMMRPGTAIPDRTSNYLRNKRQGERARNNSLFDEKDKGCSLSGTNDSQHMDQFLVRYQSSSLRPQLSSPLGKHYHSEQFRLDSALMPCDSTEVNHFGREGRRDLRDPREVEFSRPNKPQGPELRPGSYITEQSMPETKQYFSTIVQNRQEQEIRQLAIISYKKAQALKDKFRSGVTGYRFQQAQQARYHRHLKRGEFSESNWKSCVFDEAEQEKPPAKAYQFQNILSLEPKTRVNV